MFILLAFFHIIKTNLNTNLLNPVFAHQCDILKINFDSFFSNYRKQ